MLQDASAKQISYKPYAPAAGVKVELYSFTFEKVPPAGPDTTLQVPIAGCALHPLTDE